MERVAVHSAALPSEIADWNESPKVAEVLLHFLDLDDAVSVHHARQFFFRQLLSSGGINLAWQSQPRDPHQIGVREFDRLSVKKEAWAFSDYHILLIDHKPQMASFVFRKRLAPWNLAGKGVMAFRLLR